MMTERLTQRSIGWTGVCALCLAAIGCSTLEYEDVSATTRNLERQRAFDGGTEVWDGGEEAAARSLLDRRLRLERAEGAEESAEENRAVVVLGGPEEGAPESLGDGFAEDGFADAESIEFDDSDSSEEDPRVFFQDAEVGRRSTAGRCTFEGFFSVTPTNAAGAPLQVRGRAPKYRFSAVQPEVHMTTDGAWGVRVRLRPDHGPGRAAIIVTHGDGGRGSARLASGPLTTAQVGPWLDAQRFVVVRPPARFPAGQDHVVTNLHARVTWTVAGNVCHVNETLRLRWNRPGRGQRRPVFDAGTTDTSGKPVMRPTSGFVHPPGGGHHQVPTTTVHPVSSFSNCAGTEGCGHSLVQFVRHDYTMGRRAARRGHAAVPAVTYRDAWSLDILDSEITRAQAQGPQPVPAVRTVQSPRAITATTRRVQISLGYPERDVRPPECSTTGQRGAPACGQRPGPAVASYDPTYTNQPRGTNQRLAPITYQGPDHRGRPAIIQRDAPGISDALYQEFLIRGGTFRWHFLTYLVCDQQPRNARAMLQSACVSSWIEYELTATFTVANGTTSVEIGHRTIDRDSLRTRRPCRRLINMLCARDQSAKRRRRDGRLVDAYLRPRPHGVAVLSSR